jgi:hypothetical protein
VSGSCTLHYSSALLTDRDISNLGYKRDDPSTIHEDYLPVISEKGMVFGYGELNRTSLFCATHLQSTGAAHEKWAWAVRQEPGVVGAFEKVHQTEDLVVSFDTVNLSFPNRKDLQPNKPWAHQGTSSCHLKIAISLQLTPPRPGSTEGGLPLSSGSRQPPP